MKGVHNCASIGMLLSLINLIVQGVIFLISLQSWAVGDESVFEQRAAATFFGRRTPTRTFATSSTLGLC